jgi:broad specificity phosphatase PhoE
MTLLLLVRHGESAWNAERRLAGRADVPLSPLGRDQVQSLAPAVAALAPAAAVTSPLQRTRETAALLGFGDAPADERWQEADLGCWTGRAIAELRRETDGQYAAWRAGRFTPPGAESFPHMVARVEQAVRPLLAAPGAQLVVTHGGPIRAVCATLLDLAPASLIPVAPGSLTAIAVTDRPRLHAYNLTRDPEAADPPD